MTDPDDRVVDEATERESLRAEDLIDLCERYDADGESPGVSQDTLLAYARDLADREVVLETRAAELDDQEAYAISDGLLLQELDARRTDATEPEGEGGIYVVDADADRLSAYPAAWHDTIGGETDIERVFQFLEDAEPFRRDERAGTGKVSAERVIAVASAVGGMSPETARERLSELRDEGEVVTASESPAHEGLQSRGSDGEQASDLPPTLDFRNAIDEIEARADADVSETTDAIRDRLQEVAESNGAGRESLLSDIDRLTVDLETELSGKAARRAEGIRNQIDAYRESEDEGEGGTAAELSLSGATLTDDTGSEADLAASAGEPRTLAGTLVNGGDGRGVVVTCTFYDESDAELRATESGPHELGPGEQRDVEIEVYVPADAARYVAAARDASGADGR